MVGKDVLRRVVALSFSILILRNVVDFKHFQILKIFFSLFFETNK